MWRRRKWSSMNAQRRALRDALLSALRPAQHVPASQWVDEHFVLSKEYSSQPGKMKCWAFQRRPIDCVGAGHPAQEVVIMGASQMLKSQTIMAGIAYNAERDPGPMMYVAPREADAAIFSKERLAPMIRDIAPLTGIFSQVKSRDSANTIETKSFLGGQISLVGAQVPENAMARSLRYIFIDEFDRVPRQLGNEGDTLTLFQARQTNYFFNSKMVICSSPTIAGLSNIERKYAETTKEAWHVPCPHCGHKQELVWERIKWADLDPSLVWYECAACDQPIEESHKLEMIEAGEWVAEQPDSPIPGFRISQLYSMIRPWRSLVATYLKVKDNPLDLKAFKNTRLNELWHEKGDAPNWQIVKSKAEPYRLQEVPQRVLFLTAGVDVQEDRIEVAVVGWARKREAWLVDYQVLMGRTDNDLVWDLLTQLMLRSYKHPAGLDLEIRKLAIDSGFRTPEVYRWSREQGPGRVMVVKGAEFGASVIGQPLAVDVNARGKKLRRGLKLTQVNVGHLKAELYGALRLPQPADDVPTPNYVHLPDMPDEWFQQLTAEEQVAVSTARGYEKLVWKKTRARNEALDSWVYARAAHAALGADSWPDAHWSHLESELTVRQFALALEAERPRHAQPKTAERVEPAQAVAPVAGQVIQQQSSWWGKSRGSWWKR